MKEILKHRELLEKEINLYLDSRLEDFGKINVWGKDVLEKLRRFIIGGKLVRGCLIISITELLSNNDKSLVEESIKAAIAIELFQSAVLIHDDIFDRDNIRRGKPSIHYEFETSAEKKHFVDSKHYGASMATCTGDIGFFLCNELLSSMNIDSYNKDEIIRIFSREVQYVALAEMNDIHLEQIRKSSMEDIISIYKYKTARYTFSLPLTIGAIIANENSDLAEKLIKIGENLGIIFQIKDDELGIYSNISELGKSVGIDIRDNKKTIYQYLLYDTNDTARLELLDGLFGNKNLDLEGVEAVRQLIKTTDVSHKIDKIISDYTNETMDLIEKLESKEKVQHTLKAILKFNLERTK